jgi:hypothetical protein
MNNFKWYLINNNVTLEDRKISSNFIMVKKFFDYIKINLKEVKFDFNCNSLL